MVRLDEGGAAAAGVRILAAGEPGCLDEAGLVVQIRPALNGVPDVSDVIASAVLSNRKTFVTSRSRPPRSV